MTSRLLDLGGGYCNGFLLLVWIIGVRGGSLQKSDRGWVEYVYQDVDNYVCPECAHEWPMQAAPEEETQLKVLDVNGNQLQDGDSVTVIKDLKIKGSSSSVKIGTKVKNIRLVEGDHNIDCKIPGVGAMGLKSEFVKKS